jgi:hypothetical protein
LKFQLENEISQEFELVGAVIYKRLKQSGHYTYVSRDIVDTNRTWHYNDAVVTDVSEKGDLESYLKCLQYNETPYICLFKKAAKKNIED